MWKQGGFQWNKWLYILLSSGAISLNISWNSFSSMKNQENCKTPQDSWNTWGFNDFSACFILWFCSLRFLNNSATNSIRQAYDTSLTSRNAIIATKFDDETCMPELLDWRVNCSRIASCPSEQREKNKASSKTDVGTKLKCLFAEPDLLPSENCLI